MNTKTVTLGDRSFIVGPVTVSAAKKEQLTTKSGLEYNIALVAGSLRSGGNQEATSEWVEENCYYYRELMELIKAAYEINGMKVPTQGEEQPAVRPAEAV